MADKFAIVTGASSGIGLELAKLAAADGYDLLVAADTSLATAEAALRQHGTQVTAIEVDLSTFEGVDTLVEAANGRPIDVLCANAGHGLGRGFLEQDPKDWRHVVDTNIVGTAYLIQNVLRAMVGRNQGKLLVTGSIAGFMPGSFQAVYNGTKAFVDSFVDAVRDEIKEADGVTVTNLMPGATETEFFKRGDMMDTSVGTAKKDPADDVAKTGWDAMMSGRNDVVHGVKNKLQAAAAHVLPEAVTAHMHRNMAEPGSANE